ILWTTIRNAFEAAVWATLVWTASEAFFDIKWIYLFWVFFAILFLLGLKVIGTEPWLARSMVIIDPMLVGLAILQTVMTALIPTVITVAVANLVSPWIQRRPDWLHIFLFFSCACYIPWRRDGKRKAVESWKGTPIPEGETSDDSGTKQRAQNAMEDTIREA